MLSSRLVYSEMGMAELSNSSTLLSPRRTRTVHARSSFPGSRGCIYIGCRDFHRPDISLFELDTSNFTSRQLVHL
jgi:hypothetical protein